MTALALIVSLGAAALLPQWSFDTAGDLLGWAPNSHLENVRVEEGFLKADAVNWDPMLIRIGLEIPATAWQFVTIRIEATKPGSGELFWCGETSGEYGGFSPQKSTRFEVLPTRSTQDVVIFPFWHAEKTIRQLRLDLYDGAQFAIQSIKIGEWGTRTRKKPARLRGTSQTRRTMEIGPKSAASLVRPPLNLPLVPKAGP